MPERWILNASPLIILGRVNLEDLLLKLADEVVVPLAVSVEVQAGPPNDRARQALAVGRFRVVDTPAPPAELLAWDLGAGETAVLSLALVEPGWVAILDDAAARRCARSFGTPVKGTLAVILLAKQRGLIPSAKDVLRQLQAVGFHLDDALIRKVLAHTVGEQWG